MPFTFKTSTGTAGAVGVSEFTKPISPSSASEIGLITDGLKFVVSDFRVGIQLIKVGPVAWHGERWKL